MVFPKRLLLPPNKDDGLLFVLLVVAGVVPNNPPELLSGAGVAAPKKDDDPNKPPPEEAFVMVGGAGVGVDDPNNPGTVAGVGFVVPNNPPPVDVAAVFVVVVLEVADGSVVFVLLLMVDVPNANPPTAVWLVDAAADPPPPRSCTVFAPHVTILRPKKNILLTYYVCIKKTNIYISYTYKAILYSDQIHRVASVDEFIVPHHVSVCDVHRVDTCGGFPTSRIGKL